MKLLESLTGIGSLVGLVSGATPAVQGLVAGVTAIGELVSDDETQSRRKLYMEMAADLCEISGAILRALSDDDEIDDKEQAEIMKQLIEIIPGKE